MKKTYMKPEIMFESFTLCTNIAGDCGVITNSNEGSCGYLDDRDPIRIPVFTSTNTGCVRYEQDEFNGVCYHNPTETTDLFNS